MFLGDSVSRKQTWHKYGMPQVRIKQDNKERCLSVAHIVFAYINNVSLIQRNNRELTPQLLYIF